MRFHLSHRTEYVYETDVSVSHHLLRLTPFNHGRQRCLEHQLFFDPQPKSVHSHLDYYGNESVFVTLEGVHRRWRITADSVVECWPANHPAPADTPPCEQIAGLLAASALADDRAAVEFLHASPLIACRKEYAEYAQVSCAPGRPVLEAASELTRRVFTDFQFDPKATHVATPVDQVFRERRGVCQDFAQLQIACLRSAGIPALYVSGYLETQPPPGQPKLVGADASHAWVAFYCPGHGWIELDPTNNVLPSDRHVSVARGRDFGDVSPVRGVIVGGGNHILNVSVDVLRCDHHAV
jgi:transglutaminase-like putative cysteine protease